MHDIELTLKDAIYMKIDCDMDISRELVEYFSFRPSNYKFNPKFIAKIWDGYIRLYSSKTGLLYIGLLDRLKEFANERGYSVKIDKVLAYGDPISDDIAIELANEFNCPLIPHDYQKRYIADAIRDGRSLNLSPTSSGKSLIQYLLARYYLKHNECRILMIVPRLQLTIQMKDDFISYNCDPDMIGIMGDGVKVDPKTKIVVSTWQTLIKLDQSFFDEFSVVFGDEAHNFESKSLTDIMNKLGDCYYRHGFTGTISTESKVHQLVLEGMFGSMRKYVSTSDLIADKVTAEFKIKSLLLNHTKAEKQNYRDKIAAAKDGKERYQIEKKVIKESVARNEFITNLVKSLDGKNNLILFDDVDTHGKILAKMLEREGRIVLFIHGKVKAKDRDAMKKMIENDPLKRYDIVASSGTTSTGISIKRIDNAIFVMGGKGEVKTLQSIGRLLRRGNGSDDTCLYDIGDLLSNNKNLPNYSYTHFAKRLEIYNVEQFDYKLYRVDL